jgi:hypothetical protein
MHVLVADLRDWSAAAIAGRDACEPGVEVPVAVWGADARVDLGRRLARGPLCLPERSGHANGGAGLVDALVPLQRQLVCAGAGRGG